MQVALILIVDNLGGKADNEMLLRDAVFRGLKVAKLIIKYPFINFMCLFIMYEVMTLKNCKS